MSRRCLPTPKLLTIAVLAMLPALAAQAGPQQSQDRGRGHQQRGSEQRDGERGDLRERDDLRPVPRGSLSDAVRRVERNTRGEVLSAERIQYDGRDMHRVKVVDDQGRVRVFMQDPQRRDGNGNGRSQRPQRDDDDN
jgi:hypothetical protein